MKAAKEFAIRLNLFNRAETIAPERGLEYWRERIYNYLISAMLVFGLIAIIPSVWLSFTTGLVWLGIVDLAAYAIVLALALTKDIPRTVRAAILVLIGLGIGIAVFYATGDEGAGLFWLFAVPPFAALMLGLQWGLTFISINGLLIWGSTYLILLDNPIFPGLAEFSVAGWIVYGVNFLVANAIVTIPLGILMNGLLHGREREEQVARDYQLLFETNPLPMWVYELKTLAFLEINEAAMQKYGYTREEFLNLTFGVLSVNAFGPRNFDENDVNLLRILSEIVGTGIQRARLNEQKERNLEVLTALGQIDRAILSSLDLRMNLAILLRNVVDQLEVDAANIMLFNPTLQTLESNLGEGFRTDIFSQKTIQLGEGLAGLAAMERRTISANLNDLGDNPRLAKAVAEEGFVSYYGVPLIAKGEVRGVLEVFHRRYLEVDYEWLDLLKALAGRAAITIDAVKSFEDLQISNAELMLSYDSAIEGWSRALDLRDRETEGHSQRVTQLAMELAESMGLSGKELVNLRRGALLHDIGKMGVADSILFKRAKLNADEWEHMKQHPTFARDMLQSIKYLEDALDIPYAHHEKWDGSGYPRSLKDVEIPLAARIFAVVDVYDALTSDRPYRKAWSVERTLKYIQEHSGQHFDPNVVADFMNLEDIAALRKGLEPAML
ncbi:MAG: HD domain-containing phosphohydrolase [Anaerolineales bacterium]